MLVSFGALTSKTYAFRARPWELRSVNSIDIFDGLGSNTKIDFKNDEILRLLPRKCDSINGFWISNKSRYFYDAVKNNRLGSPYLKKNGRYVKVGWRKALNLVTQLFKVVTLEYGMRGCNFTYSSCLSTQSLLSLKSVANLLGLKTYNIGASSFNGDYANTYNFQMPISSLDTVSDFVFIGVDPRHEASTLNLRLRKYQQEGGSLDKKDNSAVSVVSIGATTSPIIKQSTPALSLKELALIAMGRSTVCNHLASNSTAKRYFLPLVAASFTNFESCSSAPHYLAKATSWGVYGKRVAFFYGDSLTWRADKENTLSLLQTIQNCLGLLSKKSIYLNYLSGKSNAAGAANLGLGSSNKLGISKPVLNYSVGDSVSTSAKSGIVISQSAFFNEGDILLPRALFVESSESYTNVEGVVQSTNRAVDAPGLATADWAIFRALAFAANKKSLFKNKGMLFAWGQSLSPSFCSFKTSLIKNFNLKNYSFIEMKELRLFKKPLTPSIYDFYKSNTICQHSVNLNKGSKALKANHSNYNFI